MTLVLKYRHSWPFSVWKINLQKELRLFRHTGRINTQQCTFVLKRIHSSSVVRLLLIIVHLDWFIFWKPNDTTRFAECLPFVVTEYGLLWVMKVYKTTKLLKQQEPHLNFLFKGYSLCSVTHMFILDRCQWTLKTHAKCILDKKRVWTVIVNKFWDSQI